MVPGSPEPGNRGSQVPPLTGELGNYPRPGPWRGAELYVRMRRRPTLRTQLLYPEWRGTTDERRIAARPNPERE